MDEPKKTLEETNPLFAWVVRHRVILLFATMAVFQIATWYAVWRIEQHTETLSLRYTTPCGSDYYRSACDVKVLNADEIGRAVARALGK